MKKNIYPISFSLQIFIIILFETGILNKIIGYSDWDLYRRTLLFGNNAPGFIQILNFFHNIFSTQALIIWYLIQICMNSYILSKLFKYLPSNSNIKSFILINPFFIIFYSGIFKEVILFNSIIFLALNENLFRKFITIFFYFLIRIHLAPFILFIITKLKLYTYIILSFFIFYIFNFYNFIDYTLIYGSITEIKNIGKNDLPIYLLSNFNFIKIVFNELILLFGFIFTKNIIIKFIYFITMIYIFYFFINYKLYKAFVAFLIGLFPYALIVANSGTSLRMITFLFITTISYNFIILKK